MSKKDPQKARPVSASMQRYKLENRALVHKNARIARAKAFAAKKAANPPKVPRGTARALRRQALQAS